MVSDLVGVTYSVGDDILAVVVVIKISDVLLCTGELANVGIMVVDNSLSILEEGWMKSELVHCCESPLLPAAIKLIIETRNI